MILVDEQDAWLLEAVKWRIQKTHKSDLKYVVCNAKVNGKQTIFSLHRIIAQAPPGMVVDFKNGDGLDCRRDNLRICTHAENMRNRARAKTNKVGVKGVYLKYGKFAAEIKFEGVKYNLGSFEDLTAAANAYEKAARLLHGEFARIS